MVSVRFYIKMADKSSKNVKKRNWAFVLYPESAPENWRELLQQTGIQGAISPIHNRDTNATGEHKKDHYHVILCYAGPTSYNVVKSLTNGRLGQTVPQPLEQVRGYYRYLTHADNPEKAQYDAKDIQVINGFDIRDFVEMTKSEVVRYVREIQQFVMDNNILEYSDLLEILLQGGDGMKDWYEVAINHTVLFTGYLNSRRYRVDKAKGRI